MDSDVRQSTAPRQSDGRGNTANRSQYMGGSRGSMAGSASERAAERSSEGVRAVSVKGIRNFRHLPQSPGAGLMNASYASTVGSGTANRDKSTYIGRISRGGICLFLLGLTATAFVTTFSLYMALTVFAPTDLLVYPGDGQVSTCSDTWCDGLQCQETTPYNNTAVVRVPKSFQFSLSARSVTWLPVVIDSTSLHTLNLAVSDNSLIRFNVSFANGCTPLSILVFSGSTTYTDWIQTSRSRWLSRNAIPCGGLQWSLNVASGGNFIIAVLRTGPVPSKPPLLALSTQLTALSIGNNVTQDATCASLATSCSISLQYHSDYEYLIVALPDYVSSNDTLTQGHLSKVHCTCSSRVGVYIAVFGGANAVAILLIFLGYAYRQRRRLRKRLDRRLGRPERTENEQPVDLRINSDQGAGERIGLLQEHGEVLP